jgi:DNA invertase Pin-like site-specific DNA recombinase
MEKNAVIYLRVASAEQRQEVLDQQETLCRSYCRQMHFKVVEVFTELGMSGLRGRRPELQRMLGFCKNPSNKVRFVVVSDSSRIARDLRILNETVSALSSSGVQLRSTSESSSTAKATTKLKTSILRAIDRYYSDSVSERRPLTKRTKTT